MITRYLIVARHLEAAHFVARDLKLPQSSWTYVRNEASIRGCRPPKSHLVLESGWIRGPATNDLDLYKGILEWQRRYPDAVTEVDLDKNRGIRRN